MRSLFGRIVLNEAEADAGGNASAVAERLQRAMLGVIATFTREAYDWALQHEPAE